MRSELHTLKDLIATIVRHQEKPGTLHLLSVEAERIPDAITANTFLLSTDQQIHDYLCWQQHQLIREADLLHKASQDSDRIIVRRALVIVLHMLKALKRAFPNRFDNTLPLPKAEYLRRKKKYAHIQATVSDRLKRAAIPPELITIALYPLVWFTAGSRPARYCDDCYLGSYAPALITLPLTELKPAAAEELLCARLVTLNYNGLALLDHLTGQVKDEMEAAPGKKDKERILKLFKLRLKPIQVIPGIIFDQHFMELKTALLEWAELEEETLAILPDNLKKSRMSADREPFKLTISVAILAYLARLCKINGIYPRERKHSEVLDHMVATYCTKQTTRISRDSFYNCYKAPTNNVALALRKILRSLLDDIDHFINTGVIRNEKDKP